MHPDYLKLADQYSSFLIALGGISVTVLALVLTLRKPPHSKSYAASITALVVATLACFVGSHLMSQVASLRDTAADQEKIINAGQAASESQPAPQQPPLGLRHFIYASIDVYVALMLNSFAMMLLPTAYIGSSDEKRGREKRAAAAGEMTTGNLPEGSPIAGDVPEQTTEAGGVSEQDAAGISKITIWVFRFVLISSYVWSLYFYIARIHTRQSYVWMGEVIIYVTLAIALLCGLYFVLLRWVIREEHFPQLTFFILILIIAGSGIGFISLGTVRGQFTILDAWMFCFAISISGIVLAGHSLRLYERKFVEYHRFPWAYITGHVDRLNSKLRFAPASLVGYLKDLIPSFKKQDDAESPGAGEEKETQKESPPTPPK